MFYVFATHSVDNPKMGFVKIGEELKITSTSYPSRASYWTKLSEAKTWMSRIKKKYPEAEIRRAYLKVT